jgi:YidC/Oxa1 family membrane protein insertase
MYSPRVIVWLLLAAILYLNYETWMRDYRSALPPETQTATNAPPAADSLANSVPAVSSPPSGGSAPVASDTAPPVSASAPAAATESPAPVVHVVTDVLDLSINLKGGEIDRAAIIQYPLHKDAPNIPVLLENRDPSTLYLLQSGLSGSPGDAPTHLVVWSAAQTSYTLGSGASELRVPMTWSDGQGLKVTKTFILKRGWYSLDLAYDVENDGTSPRTLAAYTQILRHWEHPSRSYFDVETYSFKGPDVYDGKKTRDLNVENEADSKFSEDITNGWLASLQHHFVSAVVPSPNEPAKYTLVVRDHEYLLSAKEPEKQIAPGAKAEFREKLFIGPKLQSQLSVTGPDLERTADYGHLYLIAQPLFTALRWVESITGNWGWAIILVTAMIKLVFYPLSQASGRSMAKMRAVAPRMKQIQETYKDDREKLGRAMMELYKREKINPLAGCLPMVIQIPFFISFYWVLLESVEMRQAPFLMWINDLSSRDPYFVLPLLMGGAMFGQFKLNPTSPDPTQAKIMQFMPLVMTGMMAWFPSGLVLYWLTNTVLSIVQQWRVNQVVQAEAGKVRS